ncbi:hypothetical protein GCM10027051_00550 [Niabella terrae]
MQIKTISDEIQSLRLVYRNYANLQGLLELFSEEYKALRIEFEAPEFMLFYELFRQRELTAVGNATDLPEPAYFWFKGRNCRFNICLEVGESYYVWSCYSAPEHRACLQRYFMGRLVK